MNRTRKLTLSWLDSTGLEGDALLLEALLRRGFLAFRDADGVWLGRGSTGADIEVLNCIEGLRVVPVTESGIRCARVRTDDSACSIAEDIVSLPEHYIEGETTYWTGTGILNLNPEWGQYRRMVWGAQRSVCGDLSEHSFRERSFRERSFRERSFLERSFRERSFLERSLGERTGHDGWHAPFESRESRAHDALDLGIALLVKALPLIRVATAYSCDGHGRERAWVGLLFPWDRPWFEAIFERVWVGPRVAHWRFGEAPHENSLFIESRSTYDDAAVLALLHEVQRFARGLLDMRLITAIGAARAATLAELGDAAPSLADFAGSASRHLDAAIGVRLADVT